MGRLAGFTYCVITKKLKKAGFLLTGQQKEVIKSGIIAKHEKEPQFQTIPATFLKEHYEQLFAKPTFPQTIF